MQKFLKPFWKRIIAKSQKLIVPSVSLENLIKIISPKVKSTIIPNGIDLNKFTPTGNREKKILVVTRMFERKGVQYFLQTLTNLKYGYNINIVGEGPYLETLKRIATDKKLKVNLGFIDNNSKELRNLMKVRGFLFLHPKQKIFQLYF
jgi:glycosyltransferase involved in cell wall biosynthesis